MYFWPTPADVRGQNWANDPSAPGGPALGDLVVALVPVFRALFLLGYRAISLNLTPSTSTGTEPVIWTSIDLQTLVLGNRTCNYPRSKQALNLAFELEELSDDDPAGYPGFGMPLPAERLGTDQLGALQPLNPETGLPSKLQTSIDNFIGQAIIALIPRMPTSGQPARNGTPQLPKTAAGGLAWILDPEHWRRYLPDDLGGTPTDALKLLVWSMTQQASRVLTGLVYGRRGAPDAQPEAAATLDWLFRVIGENATGLGDFSTALRQYLQERGDAHLLSETNLARLFWSRAAFTLPWLDVLVELLCRGVLCTSGLLQPPDPPEPLIERNVSTTKVELLVWGERTITLRREVAVNGSTGVRGSAAWEYIRGNATVPPTVVIVAGRGIGISADLDGVYGWKLQVFRVQSDVLIPDPSARVETWTFLTSKLVEDPWEVATPVVQPGIVLARPLADGLHLEFPVFGGVERPPDDEEVDDNKPLPFAVRLAVDPMSARDWYCVDVAYYTYTFEAEERLAAHLVVWCTPGVKITCSESSVPNPNSPSGISNGAMATHSPSGTNPLEPPWRVSAEFWHTAPGAAFPQLWSTRLPVTYDLVIGDRGSEPLSLSAPELTGTRGADTVPYTSGDGGIDVSLTRHPYGQEVFFRHEGQLLDVVDLAIGAVPIIGDLVDVAETVNAWQTGTDKWGRPVSTFQIALMTVCTAVPFVSGSFGREVGELIGARADALLHGSALSKMFSLVVAGFQLGEADLKEVLHGSERFARSKGKQMLVDELGRFIANNPRTVGDYVVRICNEGGPEWLSISDLRHPTRAGFRINLLDDDFGRYRSFFPTATEEQYLEHGISGAPRVLAECLLGSTGIRRTLPLSISPPFLAYLPSPGPFVSVTDLAAGGTTRSVINEVRRIAQEALDHSSTMRFQTLNHAGFAADAGSLTPFTKDEVAAQAEALLNLVTGNKIDSATAEQLTTVLGNDQLNGVLVTLDERCYRLAESIVTAMYEARRVSDDAAVLSQPAMLEPLRDYVRQMMGRPVYPWGPRFELRTSATVVADFADQIAAQRFALAVQQLAPDVLGKQLRSGVDLTLHVDLGTPSALGYPIQLKAVKDLEAAGIGPVRLIRNDLTGKIEKVVGPDIVKQAVQDEVRRAPFDGWMPPASLKKPPLSLPNDPLGEGWVRDSGQRIIIIDDEHLTGHLTQLLYDTAERTGTGGISVDLNDVDLPDSLKLTVQDALLESGWDPSAIDLLDLDELVRVLQDEVIETVALRLEDAIAESLARIPVADLPEKPVVRVLLGSQGTDPIRDIIGKPKPKP